MRLSQKFSGSGSWFGVLEFGTAEGFGCFTSYSLQPSRQQVAILPKAQAVYFREQPSVFELRCSMGSGRHVLDLLQFEVYLESPL